MSGQDNSKTNLTKKIKVEKEDFDEMYLTLDTNNSKKIHNPANKKMIFDTIEDYLNQEPPSDVMNFLKEKYKKSNNSIADAARIKRNRVDTLFKENIVDYRDGINKISPVDLDKIARAYSSDYLDPEMGLLDVNEEEIDRLMYSVYPKMRLTDNIFKPYELTIDDSATIEEFCETYLIKNSILISTNRGKHSKDD